MSCGGGPCAYYVVENGAYGLNNTVTPYFSGYSITDQWRPNDQLFFNFGLRVDNYSYVGANTMTGAARDFWFNAFNQDTCFDKQTLTLVDRSALVGGRRWSTNSQQPVLELRQASTSTRTCKTRPAPSTTTSCSRASA